MIDVIKTKLKAWWRWIVVGGVMLILLAMSALIALRLLFSAPPPPAAPGLLLAKQLRLALASETSAASTAYVPGDGLIVYTYVPDQNTNDVRAWAESYLAPFAVQLNDMPAGERLRWVIETGRPPDRQETLTAPLRDSDQIVNFESRIMSLTEIENAIASVIVPPPKVVTVTIISTSTPAPIVQPTITSITTVTPTVTPTVEPILEPTVAVSITEPISESAVITENRTTIEQVEPAGTVVTLGTETVLSEQTDVWQTVQGEWIVENGRVVQTETGQYDRIALYRSAWMRPPYTLTSDITVDEGDLGAGLVFNAQSTIDKTRAHMLSFTANGDYLQWGYFDDEELFIFQNGTFVTGLTEGRTTHTIRVEVGAETYAVYLNDVQLTDSTPLVYPRGYVGLFANLSVTAFDNIFLIGEAITPE